MSHTPATHVSSSTAFFVIALTLLLSASLLLSRDYILRTLPFPSGWAIYWNEVSGPRLDFTVTNDSPETEFSWKVSRAGNLIASGQVRVPSGTKTAVVPTLTETDIFAQEKIILEVTSVSGAKRELLKLFP